MTFFWLALWLQMSAQPMDCGQGYSYPPAQGVGCYTDPGIVPRAADETDGKPLCTIDAVTHKISPPECAAEPVDVPAVQETRTYKTGTSTIKAAPECEGKPTCNIVIATQDIATEQVTTCTDKSRVLLTSEDGKKHCIKF